MAVAGLLVERGNVLVCECGRVWEAKHGTRCLVCPEDGPLRIPCLQCGQWHEAGAGDRCAECREQEVDADELE